MTNPSRLGLGLALLTALFTSACDQGQDNRDTSRLAVVLVSADGNEQSVGSYDVESGEITFAPAMQDDMRVLVGGNGFAAIVAHDGEDAEVDIDEGVAATTPDLEDGDVLDLRAARSDVGTSTIGRLELRVDTEEVFRTWKEGNITGMDDWHKHNV